MKNVFITLKNGNQGVVEGDYSVLNKLYNDFSFKHPNAFYIQRNSKVKWDGIVHFINKGGYFKIGLLGLVCKKLDEYKVSYEIEDLRRKINIKPVIPTTLGDLTLRPRQIEAIKNLLSLKIGGIPFYICAADYSVNFGKSLVFCAIHKAFKFKLKTILLLNDASLFEQFKKEIPKLLPEEKITFVQGGKVFNWGNFTVAMVQSVSQNLKNYTEELLSFDIVLLDEADVIDNNTYKRVIEKLYNSSIRIGLSGTLYSNHLKKHTISHMSVKSFIGEIVDQVKLVDQIKEGNSTPIVIKVIELPEYNIEYEREYSDQYKQVVVDHKLSYNIIKDRIDFNLSYGRKPILVVAKYIEHCERIKTYIDKHYPNLKVGMVHVNVKKDRNKILSDFREGKLDILVTTKIIFRGKNLPLLKYTLNVSSMDSKEGTIQLLGRLVRKDASKNVAYIDDIVFPGSFLRRHGNHRKNYYLSENLKVILLPRNKKKRRAKSLKAKKDLLLLKKSIKK